MSYGATGVAASSSSSGSKSRHNMETETGGAEVYVPRNAPPSTLLLALKTAAIVFLFAGLSVLGVSMSNSYGQSTRGGGLASSKSFLDEATDTDSGRVTYSLLTTDQTLTLFDDFITTYNRDYAQDADEYNKRLMVFRSNLDICDDRNAKESLAGGTAVHGITRFSDLTTQEFSTTYLMEDDDETTSTTKTTTTTTTTDADEKDEDEDEDEEEDSKDEKDEDEDEEEDSKDENEEVEEDTLKSSGKSSRSSSGKKSKKSSSSKKNGNKSSSKKNKGKRSLQAAAVASKMAIRERVRHITAKHDAITSVKSQEQQQRKLQGANNVFTAAAQRTRRLSDPTIKYQDWSADGYTTDVKNSGSCAGSWAIAAAEQIESDGIIGGVITANDDLSAQQILSCTDGQDGCSGGSLEDAIAYVQKPGGLFKTADYAWSSNDGVVEECEVPTKPYAVTVGGVFELNTDDIATNTERLMVQRLSNTGTLAGCMDATIWSTYVSGTINNCDSNSINHCAQIVGVYYSSAEDSGFYKIRNHWGTDWGIEGYVSIAYGSDVCGIAHDPLYTDVVGSDATKRKRSLRNVKK